MTDRRKQIIEDIERLQDVSCLLLTDFKNRADPLLLLSHLGRAADATERLIIMLKSLAEERMREQVQLKRKPRLKAVAGPYK